MVLLDSNIFIVDRFFPRDSLYSQNKSFVEKLDFIDAAIFVLHASRGLRRCVV